MLWLLGKFPPEKIAQMIDQLPKKEKETVDKIFGQYQLDQPNILPPEDCDFPCV